MTSLYREKSTTTMNTASSISHQKHRELITLLLFIFIELLMIPLKKYLSDTDGVSIISFLIYQIIALSIPLLFYFLSLTSPKKTALQTLPNIATTIAPKEPPPISTTQTSFEPIEKKQEEKELITFLQNQIEEQKKELEERSHIITDHEATISHIKQQLDSLFLLTKTLSHDIKVQQEQIEETRRRHALEMRVLVMKEMKQEASNSAQQEARSTQTLPHRRSTQKELLTIPSGISVESAIIRLFSQATDTPSKESRDTPDGEFPSTAYPHLLKRKLYESIQRMSTIAIGVTNRLDPKNEMELASPLKKEEALIYEALEKIGNSLIKTAPLEPIYYNTSTNALIVFFRCPLPGLEDLVFFGKSS